MLPAVALVGRPNVGKSTLFNRLTATRDALVADYPGLTRDRRYGVGRFGDRRFIVIDTGGLTAGDSDRDERAGSESGRRGDRGGRRRHPRGGSQDRAHDGGRADRRAAAARSQARRDRREQVRGRARGDRRGRVSLARARGSDRHRRAARQGRGRAAGGRVGRLPGRRRSGRRRAARTESGRDRPTERRQIDLDQPAARGEPADYVARAGNDARQRVRAVRA